MAQEKADQIKSQPEAPKAAPVDYLTIAGDFGKSFLQSAGITPIWNGLGELVSGGHLPKVSITSEENAKASTADRWAQNIGGALGVAADIFALSKLKPLVLGSATTAESLQAMSLGERALTQSLEGTKLGAFYGGVLTPSDPNGNLVTGRLKNMLSQGLTFGLLGGGAEAAGGLKSFANLRSTGFANALTDVGISGAVGAPAGIIGSAADATLNGKKFGSEEVKEAAINYGVIGMAITGLTHGLGAFKSTNATQAAESPSANGSSAPEWRTADGGNQLAGNILAHTNYSKFTEEHSKFTEEHVKNALAALGVNRAAPNLVTITDGHVANGISDGGNDLFSPFHPEHARSIDENSEQSARAYMREMMRECRSKMDEIELPASSVGDRLDPRFIGERASRLDAHQLGLSKSADEMSASTKFGDKVLDIKRYINTAGEPARGYLARVIRNNDVTIIGEQHTYEGVNPHRKLGARIVTELPPGTTLAVEMPRSLRNLFDKFNTTPGRKVLPLSEISDKKSMQPALKLLRSIQANDPDIIEMWQAARDFGVRIVPIDAEREGYSAEHPTDEHREKTLADAVLALHREDKTIPVVVWEGNMHAAKTLDHGVSTMARRIAESPEFASGESKLSTVLSQLAETEAETNPLHVLAKKVRKPVGLPTTQNGQPTPISDLDAYDPNLVGVMKSAPKVADWDHLVLYPPASPEVQNDYYFRKKESLIADSEAEQVAFPAIASASEIPQPESSIWSRIEAMANRFQSSLGAGSESPPPQSSLWSRIDGLASRLQNTGMQNDASGVPSLDSLYDSLLGEPSHGD